MIGTGWERDPIAGPDPHPLIAGAREASRAALRTGPHHVAHGLPVFAVTFLLAAAAIALCVRLVRRNLAATR